MRYKTILNSSPSTSMTSSCNLFYKIIPRKYIEDGNLKIPSKFTRKYGVGLSNPVLLKPPDGTEWKVYWTKHVGDIWFQKGWKEFAAYYSIDYGHLLLFKYEETSHFNVHIFDMSTLEINYPFHGTQDEKNNLEQIIDDSVEILDELAPCRKSPMSCPQPYKKLRTDRRDVERSSNLEKLHLSVETKGSHSQRTNFEKSPFAYAGKEPNCPPSQESIEGDGVNCLEHERIPVAESKVNVTRKGEKETQKTSLPISPQTHITGALKDAKKFTSQNPFFMVDIVQGYLGQNRPVLIPWWLKYNLMQCVPVDFTRKYFNKKKQNVTLQLGNKFWPLKLLCYPYNTPSKLSSGWSLFVEESKLQVRDICIFELINREDAIFDVHIFRGGSYP
ncbi:PREDICTED: B3 domain-containing transcription factor VRN1-like isoform X1 [Lupinus angustifolius]|uniref:B3 domain-containing transcription factor VRN1-like isoform X1 n=1 Tax=Lupinus angustifolius TaxID=3871 RepID=UPI00092E6A5E|nr:PREDICTED: B3 domain-containing transcription factor VRN1-like isoform X1 [Lupinus angustifolius]